MPRLLRRGNTSHLNMATTHRHATLLSAALPRTHVAPHAVGDNPAGQHPSIHIPKTLRTHVHNHAGKITILDATMPETLRAAWAARTPEEFQPCGQGWTSRAFKRCISIF